MNPNGSAMASTTYSGEKTAVLGDSGGMDPQDQTDAAFASGNQTALKDQKPGDSLDTLLQGDGETTEELGEGYDEYGQDIYEHPALVEDGYSVYKDADGEYVYEKTACITGIRFRLYPDRADYPERLFRLYKCGRRLYLWERRVYYYRNGTDYVADGSIAAAELSAVYEDEEFDPDNLTVVYNTAEFIYDENGDKILRSDKETDDNGRRRIRPRPARTA
jgi:hypothetical protein